MTAPASHDVLAGLTADVRQLTAPIHLAAGRRIVAHPPLLDQLRNAAVPGATTHGPERHQIPGSRPPARLDVIDLLSGVTVGISMWHAKLRLPSPPEWRYGCQHTSCHQRHHQRAHGPLCPQASIDRTDWQAAVLRMLVDEAPNLAPSIADWLALDVHGWWTDCARGSGWRTADLLRIR